MISRFWSRRDDRYRKAFQNYRVVDGSDPNTVVVIDDEGDTVAYETARFHGPRETYEDWIDRTAKLVESYAAVTEH